MFADCLNAFRRADSLAYDLKRHLRFAALCSACVLRMLCWPTGLAAADADYGIQAEKTATIQGVFSFEVHAPDMTVDEWVLLAAAAPELPGQTHPSTRLLPEGEPCTDKSLLKRSLVRSRIPVRQESQQHSMRGQIEWRATLFSRHLLLREPNENYRPPEKLSTNERRSALAATPTLDFSAQVFQRWLRARQLRKEPSESDLDFARRAFLAISRSWQYDFAEKMDRRASVVCKSDRADCGGMSALYVATLRANKIPARLLAGFWAKSADANPTLLGVPYHQQHIKAEFYVKDVGWTPVDISAAVQRDQSPEGLRFFGHDEGDFLTVHVDPDLEIDGIFSGAQTLSLLQGMHYFVTGSGKIDSATIDVDWQVQTLP